VTYITPEQILRACRHDCIICGDCGINVLNSITKHIFFNPNSKKYYLPVKVTVIDNGKLIVTVELVCYMKQPVRKAYCRKFTGGKIIRVK
jgi:hypothetical protein